jgi:molybdate transport system substrate-binding protein
MADLAQPGIKLVLAQAEVPVGSYSRTAIDNLAASPQYGTEYADRVLGNLVSEETNVRNVAQKVALGEADAGIVYQTDAMTPDIAERVRVIPIPDQFNVIASYPIAALSESAQADLGGQFVDFVLSDEGEQILAEYGFGPAGSGETS